MIGKLVVDYEEVSLGDLLKSLTDKGIECCVDGDNIYVYGSELQRGSGKLYNSEREENTKLFLQRINFSADSHADKLRANLAFREIQ